MTHLLEILYIVFIFYLKHFFCMLNNNSGVLGNVIVDSQDFFWKLKLLYYTQKMAQFMKVFQKDIKIFL